MSASAHSGSGRVVWTHAAERRLHAQLSRLHGRSADRRGSAAGIDAALAAAFPAAEVVIVLEMFAGFQPRPGEYVLLADVRGGDRPGTAVVKVGNESRLRAEAEAWAACRPAGFRGDAVFLEQESRYDPDDATRLCALVYQDARRHVGSGRLVSLEEAFIGAVRFGTPAAASVAAAITEVFRRLGENLYVGAGSPQPLAVGIEINPESLGGPRRKLAASLDRWSDAEPSAIRRLCSVPVGARSEGFRDPVYFLGVMRNDLDQGNAGRWATIRLHRGPAHGDLHGRNVLVGVTDHREEFSTADNRAEQPALFDYEHMSPDNLIGWDVAKLEVELKVRAYRHAFPYVGGANAMPTVPHLAGVLEMEQQLARSAPAFRPSGGVAPPTPEQGRLFELMIALRRVAASHLGTDRRHDLGWEKEYNFLLAAYGVYGVRYSYRPSERAAAYLSAGVAAAQLP